MLLPLLLKEKVYRQSDSSLHTNKYHICGVMVSIVLGQLPLHHICRRRGTRRWFDGRVLTAASGTHSTSMQ